MLLLEFSLTLWIVPLFFYCVTLAWREQLLTFAELPMVVTYGAASYILALGIRLTALNGAYDPTLGIPILRYYKCLLLCCGAGVAVIWGLMIAAGL
jgi:hypothetical protein